MATFIKEHIVIVERCRGPEEAIRLLGDRFLRTGTVGEEYIDRVLARERDDPTGLSLEGGINAAIPHADPVGVFRSGVALGVIRQGVGFKEMVSERMCGSSWFFCWPPIRVRDSWRCCSGSWRFCKAGRSGKRLLSSEREEQILRILAKGDQPFRGEEPW